MPFAVTHVLVSVICVDLYRHYVTKHKGYFTLHTLFIAAFAGLLPDIDIPLNSIISLFGAEIAHRTFTHTPFFGLLFLIPAFIYWHLKKHKIAMYFFVTCFAVLLHITLDYVFAPDYAHGLMLFYPISYQALEIGVLGSLGTLATVKLYSAVDACLFLLWLWHQEIKHKIRDYF